MTKNFVVNIDGMDVSVEGRRRLRICIGIPVADSVDKVFFRMILSRIEEWSQTFDIIPIIDSTFSIDESRNTIAKTAIDNKCDYIFFIDSDILVQKGQLEKLISHDKDAITGVYYMRSMPYYSILRKKMAHRIYTAMEPYGTELINIDGTGLGCFLVKTSVFDKIEYPWFQYKYFEQDGKWRHIGEDLYFCEQLQNAKTDIYCDPTVQCDHIGTIVIMDIVKKFKDLRLSISEERQKCIEELSEFTGLSIAQASQKCIASTEMVANQYKRDIIESSDHPGKFYKKNKDYIFDLINWHIGQRNMFDIRLIDEIKNTNSSAKKILDFGSGCGQNAIDLAKEGYDVAMADFDGYTSQFARFRAKKRGLNIRFYDIEMPINDKFDIILAFDVLEHIPDEEFEKTVNLLKSLKKNGGKILTTVSFGNQNGKHPMHYEESPRKVELIKQLNENN